MYDIVKNRSRNKVAKACLEAGIYRVQYSVFLGNLNNAQRKELKTKILDLINEKDDSVYILPMCKKDFNSSSLLGQAFNKELINDELKAFLV